MAAYGLNDNDCLMAKLAKICSNEPLKGVMFYSFAESSRCVYCIFQ